MHIQIRPIKPKNASQPLDRHPRFGDSPSSSHHVVLATIVLANTPVNKGWSDTQPRHQQEKHPKIARNPSKIMKHHQKKQWKYDGTNLIYTLLATFQRTSTCFSVEDILFPRGSWISCSTSCEPEVVVLMKVHLTT